MAEITKDMTLGQALDLAQNRATEANEKNAAKNVGQLKTAISKGKLGENVSLESPYFSTVKGKDYLTNIQAGKGKVETDFYVKAQALEKYTNQALVESGLTDLTTNVTGATGLAKDVGAKGQLRGEQAMRGMIPFAEIDKIYAQGFNEMRGDKAVSDATKDFLIYHRYTSHRVGTILNDTDDYKSLRLSDISIMTDKDGGTSVSIKGEVRGKKKRYATTYTGSFAEFLKGVYNKAKSESPNMPNSEIKLFGTSPTKVNQAWKKYLLPKFLDQHEISLPVDRKGNVVTGLTEIIRSANIEALESDLGLASNLGDDFMGHTAQGTKAKSYKVNTPESKAIGSVTENMVKTSAFNLGTGTTNNLFLGYGLNAPTLDVSNEGVKVYDSHKSEFKFNADALKEVVAPRPPTEFEIKEADAIAKRNISLLESETEDIEIAKLKKRQERAELQKQVMPLEQEAMVKKIQEKEKERELRKKLKKESILLNAPASPDDLSDGLKSKLAKFGIMLGKKIPIVAAGLAYKEAEAKGMSPVESILYGASELTPVPASDVEAAGAFVKQARQEGIPQALGLDVERQEQMNKLRQERLAARSRTNMPAPDDIPDTEDPDTLPSEALRVMQQDADMTNTDLDPEAGFISEADVMRNQQMGSPTSQGFMSKYGEEDQNLLQTT